MGPKIELSLRESIPAAKVRQMYVSIDHGPVQFRAQNARFWLPQGVTSPCGDSVVWILWKGGSHNFDWVRFENRIQSWAQKAAQKGGR